MSHRTDGCVCVFTEGVDASGTLFLLRDEVRPPMHVLDAHQSRRDFSFSRLLCFTAYTMNEHPSCSGSGKVQNVHNGLIWKMGKGYNVRPTSAAVHAARVALGLQLLACTMLILASIASKHKLSMSNSKHT